MSIFDDAFEDDVAASKERKHHDTASLTEPLISEDSSSGDTTSESEILADEVKEVVVARAGEEEPPTDVMDSQMVPKDAIETHVSVKEHIRPVKESFEETRLMEGKATTEDPSGRKDDSFEKADFDEDFGSSSSLIDVSPFEKEGSSEKQKMQDGFYNAYDLVSTIEDTLEESKGGLLNPSIVRVNKDELLALLKELKKVLPVQLERAAVLMREAESSWQEAEDDKEATHKEAVTNANQMMDEARQMSQDIVEEAHKRAGVIIEEARKKAEYLSSREEVVRLAQEKGRDTVEEAQRKANRLVTGANSYSMKSMTALSSQLKKIQTEIESGIDVLRQRQAEVGEEMDAYLRQGDQRDRERRERGRDS